jgi:NADPH-dependent 2,4-dienoyl-CoA reductase/sulfur reductase-like enzyme/nitrite reductase/ring-hydroxylating ferredoxin subunit
LNDPVALIGIGAAVAAVVITVVVMAKSRVKGEKVMQVADMKPNSMKTVKVGGKDVLLVRTEDKEFHAVGAKCTHYRAPLEKGVLSGDRVVCPWHAASFNVRSGDIEDGPALDHLPKFATTVKNGAVYVDVPAGLSTQDATKRCPGFCTKSSDDARQFVIIGNGPAAQTAVETLRAEGFEGSITLIADENSAPYDRTKMSKNMQTRARDALMRKPEEWSKLGVTEMLGEWVTQVDSETKQITCRSGKTVSYDKLLCATGGKARSFVAPERFTISGADAKNVHVMRFASDAQAVSGFVGDKGKDTRVVIVGSSFIGMEAAAHLYRRVQSVDVIGMETQPFERVLGLEVGEYMRKLHEREGINFHMRSTVKEFIKGPDGEVTGVRVSDGDGSEQTLEADVVVIGAGIIPSMEYLRSTVGVTLGNGIEVDETLKAADDIYAAGDIACFPYQFDPKKPLVRVEHWDVAADHGRVAAMGMLGRPTTYEVVPFFWTAQFSAKIRYAGHAKKPDDIIIDGVMDAENPKETSFTAYYVENGVITAVATVSRDPEAVAAAELLRARRMPKPEYIKTHKPLLTEVLSA